MKKVISALAAIGAVLAGLWLVDYFSEKENLSLAVYKHVKFSVPGTVIEFGPLEEGSNEDHVRVEGTENSRIIPVKLDGRSGTYAVYLGYSCGDYIPIPGTRVTVEIHTTSTDGPILGLESGRRPATNAFLECRKKIE